MMNFMVEGAMWSRDAHLIAAQRQRETEKGAPGQMCPSKAFLQ
jgi:hypothetical protein